LSLDIAYSYNDKYKPLAMSGLTLAVCLLTKLLNDGILSFSSTI